MGSHVWWLRTGAPRQLGGGAIAAPSVRSTGKTKPSMRPVQAPPILGGAFIGVRLAA